MLLKNVDTFLSKFLKLCSNFWQIGTFGGALTPPVLSPLFQILCAGKTHMSSTNRSVTLVL